jgi:hypothetical protein
MEQTLKEREVDRKRAMEMEEGPVSDKKKKKEEKKLVARTEWGQEGCNALAKELQMLRVDQRIDVLDSSTARNNNLHDVTSINPVTNQSTNQVAERTHPSTPANRTRVGPVQ